MKKPTDEKPVSPEMYDEYYFLNTVEGSEQFNRSHGAELSKRLAVPLDLAQIKPGDTILDLACGRGEIVLRCAQKGAQTVGVDFSSVALQIASSIKLNSTAYRQRMNFTQAEANYIPFSKNTFDVIFMLDIVEHLYPAVLLRTFQEANRVLKPGGRLIIHTMPNADYYRFGYPVYRKLNWVLHKNLPKDPRDRWYHGKTHVNVQNPRGMRKSLYQAGFRQVNVWLEPLGYDRPLALVTSFFLWRWVLVNDILGLAIKS